MKLFKDKKDTLYTELYADFIRNVANYTPKIHTDEMLEKSFHRINEQLFEGKLEQPNLKWGKHSRRQLGLYDYHSDTITISSIFKDHLDVVDYIMYHELLHKDEKFTHKKGRSHHHTKTFREREQAYPHYKEMEKKIEHILSRKLFMRSLFR